MLSYAKDFCVGQTFYFNTLVLPDKRVIGKLSAEKEVQRRSGQLLRLGLSLGNVLACREPVEFSMALLTLFEEFEYSTSDMARQKIAQIFKKTKGNTDSVNNLVDNSYLETGRFRYLEDEVRPPFELDFLEVFYSLCCLLDDVYERASQLMESASGIENSSTCLDTALCQYDSKVKRILSTTFKDIEKLFDIDSAFEELRI